MYERIVRQMAFMGRGAPGAVVVSSALCKSIDQPFSWQCFVRLLALGLWLLAEGAFFVATKRYQLKANSKS